MLLMLAAGCHRGRQATEEEPITPTHDSIAASIPEDPPPTADTTPTAAQGEAGLQMRMDTAERTDLRIFARKQKVIYDARLLEGEWEQEGKRMEYRGDGSGRYWNTHDDVMREEAKNFSWTMDSNLLTIVYRMEMGGVVPKAYVVTFVDRETLSYRDAYGSSYLWDRAPSGDGDRMGGTLSKQRIHS